VMPDLMFASLWLLLPHLKNHQKSVQILKPDKQTKPLLTQDKPTEMFKISNQPELIHPESKYACVSPTRHKRNLRSSKNPGFMYLH